jgi:hypothetical protein
VRKADDETLVEEHANRRTRALADLRRGVANSFDAGLRRPLEER